MVILDAKWKKLLNDRRYNGILLAVVLTAAFIGISLLVNQFLHGAPWFLFSSALRILFGAGILLAARKLYGRPAGEVLRLNRAKAAPKPRWSPVRDSCCISCIISSTYPSA